PMADKYVIVRREPRPDDVGAWSRHKNGFHFHDDPEPGDTSDYGAYRALIASAAAPISLEEIVEVLREMIYEATHLSPQGEDGSHRCRISKRALDKARAAL